MNLWQELTTRLNAAGTFVPQLFLRLILFWEFWEAGIKKLEGGTAGNWFASIHEKFPFPFNVIDPSISWTMATWGELIGATLILTGLFTRFAAISLIILTVVATAAVHWPAEWNSLSELWQGYAITNDGHGNFKLPLLYLAMLFPLLFSGAGKFSLDNLLAKLTGHTDSDEKISDLSMWGLAMMAIGIPMAFLIPTYGLSLAGAGFIAVIVKKLLDPV